MTDESRENKKEEKEELKPDSPSSEASEDELVMLADPKEEDTAKEPNIDISPAPMAKKKWYSFLKPENIFIPKLRRRLGTKARPLGIAVLICLLILAACGTYFGLSAKTVSKETVLKSNFKLDVAKFELTSTVPSDNATNVNTASKIVLNFSQPVTASRMINNMFITPNVNGTFKQGDSNYQIVFSPATALAQGTKFGIMINGTFANNGGTQLGRAYMYNFTTSVPANGILFQDQNGLIDNLSSLPSGQKVTYSLMVGSEVGSGASVTLYQGNTSDMLSSLVYNTTSVDGFSSSKFSDLSVSTSGLKQISSLKNVTDNATFSVQQPDGLYVAVATNASGKEVGLVWINFSNFGVLVRQDDQKLIMDAQSFSNGQDVSVNSSLYNLDDSVNELGHPTVDGLTSVNVPFSPSLDIIVATDGSETSVVPVNIPDSGGDIRVDQSLSSAQQVYGVTDKSTYQAGQNINYAGFVRDDNDAQYTNPGSGTVKLYISRDKYATPLTSFVASIDSNGMFSGSVPTSSSWLTPGDAFDQFQIFASAVDGNVNNNIPVASFTLTNANNPTTNLAVSFSKSSYLSSDSVTATVTGTNSNGSPLANTIVDLNIYSQDYYENNPNADLYNYGDQGTQVTTTPVTVTLNAEGQATYTLNTSQLPNDGTSQEVTLQANLPNQSGVGAAGAASAIIHQGDGSLSFGPDRSTIPVGSDLTAEVYANHLNGNPMSSATVSYVLTIGGGNSPLTTGSVTTGSNGEASIDIPSSVLSSSDYMHLDVSTTDEYGNTIQASTGYSVATSYSNLYDTSGAGLYDLNITGSSTNLSVGQQVNLNVSSPSNIRAMVTMDRGRIYNQQMVNLTKGNNSFSFNVSADLAPSFTLTFNYFLNGAYHSEGVAFNVSDQTQAAKVTISPSSQSASANQPTTVQIATTDSSGNPLATDLIVDVDNTNSYDLTSQVNPNIFNVLFNPRPIMTSSSSSLTAIGSGGGRCGGGGGELPSFANAIGTTLYWQPELATNSSGTTSISFSPPSGSWTISVYAMSGNTQVGYSSDTISAN